MPEPIRKREDALSAALAEILEDPENRIDLWQREQALDAIGTALVQTEQTPDLAITCKCCGWDFIVKLPRGLDKTIYHRSTEWFCPHLRQIRKREVRKGGSEMSTLPTVRALRNIAKQYGNDSAVREALVDVRLFADVNGLDFYQLLDDSYQLYLESKQGTAEETLTQDYAMESLRLKPITIRPRQLKIGGEKL